MNALKAVGGLVSSVFWVLGVAGYIGLNIPYLTDEDAFVFVQGNRLDGGWGFNYSMAVAFALSIVSILAWAVPKMWDARSEWRAGRKVRPPSRR